MRIVLFLFIIAITSCTVQKRVHHKGWHVQWNKQLPSKNIPSEEKEVTNLEEDEEHVFDKDLDLESKRLTVKFNEPEQNSIENSAVFDKIFTYNSNDKERTQVENEPVINENSNIPPGEKKTKKELGSGFWFTIGIVLGLIAIAAAVLLFYVAANATLVSTTVLSIFGGVILALLGLFIILAVAFVYYTNGMI
jgi:hypothetical protein